MDIAVFAQLMAQLCLPRFAELILQVPVRHVGKDELSRKLINTISHADKMAAMPSSAQAKEMIYTVAEKAFNTAVSSTYDLQSEGARVVIALIAHADGMGRIVSEASGEIFDVVRPIVKQPLPAQQQDLDALMAQSNAITSQISRISHRVNMDRMVRRGTESGVGSL